MSYSVSCLRATTPEPSYSAASVDEVATLFRARRRIPWTLEEDKLLTEGFKRLGKNWPGIRREFLPRRTEKQISMRWTRQLDEKWKMGRWSTEEDAILLETIAKYKGKEPFSAVSKALGTRNVAQIHYRYHNRWKNEIRSKLKTTHNDAMTSNVKLFRAAALDIAKQLKKDLPSDTQTTRPFTKKEDDMLRRAYGDYGSKWKIIQRDFPNRTQAELFSRWWNHLWLTDVDKSRPWTPDEDRKVMEGYEKYLLTGKVWQRTALELLPQRTPHEINVRWRKINPAAKRGRWTAEEDRLFMEGLEKYGIHRIARIRREYLPQRSTGALRAHYALCIHRKLNPKPWTKEEDKLLVEAVGKYGRSWSKIVSQLLPDRLAYEIAQRWRIVEPRFGTRRGQKWTPEDDALVRKWRQEGKQLLDVALEMGRAPTAVNLRTNYIKKTKTDELVPI